MLDGQEFAALEALAREAVECGDWAIAFDAAGRAMLAGQDGRGPCSLLAETCFLLGDAAMGEAWLRLTRSLPASSDLCAGEEADAALDARAAQWRNRGKSAAAPERQEAPTVRLVAGGDVMLGRQLPGWVALRGAAAPFAQIAPTLRSADLALVNLETCLSTEGDFLDKGGRQPYYYRNLPEMLDVLIEAGIGCVATGNNHAMDFGPQALAQQTDILDACGFLHFGAGRNRKEAAFPKYAQVRGTTVAFISVETETPCMAAGEKTPGIHHAPPGELVRVVAGSIAVARARADLVIVSPHWGANWEEAPTPEIREAARCWIDLGADAVLGHSAHILQGVEFHAGRPIVYDMGTLLFDRVNQGRMKDSALFELEWDAAGTCRLTVLPVRLERARATWAVEEDFRRIRDLVLRLSRALDPEAVIEGIDTGLRFEGVPVPSLARRLAKLAPEKIFSPGVPPQLPPALRELKSNLVHAAMPPVEGAWATPLRLHGAFEVLGAHFASPVRPGRGFVCEVYFRAAAPAAGSRVEARIVGLDMDGDEVFAYTHPVSEGIHPPPRWRYDEVTCDRVVVRPVKVLPEGRYRLCWSLVDLERGGEAWPAEAANERNDERVVDGRIYIGDLTVSNAAPNGVAGVASPLRLPRAEGGRCGGWQGRTLEFWHSEAKPWAAEVLAKAGVTMPPAQPEVIRDGRGVLVIRVESDAGSFFFKALEHRNCFEPGLLRFLGEKQADWIALPLAVCTERAWMLTADYGKELRESTDPQGKTDAWLEILPKLAEMQIESCTQVDHLLALGVPDRRLPLLPEKFGQLLADAPLLPGLRGEERAAAQQRLSAFGTCCRLLAGEPFSAGLDHGDLHPGNVLVREGRAVLFDWDTAWVTHPFCSLLLPYHASGLRNADALAKMSETAHAYLAPWALATGQSPAELLPRLHHALWAAHAIRALCWAEIGMPELAVKWIRLWKEREPLLAGDLPKRTADAGWRDPSPMRPSSLATPGNPLLLDQVTMARVTGGTWENVPDDAFFTGISFNRKYMAEGTSGNLYLAVNADPRDETFDARTLEAVRKALAAGAVAAVVPADAPGLPEGLPVLRVDRVMAALDRMGYHVRDHLFAGKRVLVSGTEGKTGFKNMLHHVLSPQMSAHATTNSSNLGFSILASLASIRREDRVAIIEAAGTHPGRLAARSEYVRPHLFVLTEVGNEHVNYHGSQQGVIESKADIVTGLVDGGYGLLNADSRNYAAVRKSVLARRRVPLLLFGSASTCNGRLLDRRFEDNLWIVTADIEGQRVEYRLPLLGDHAPLASVSVLLAAWYLGADVAQAAADFYDYRPYESEGVLRHIAHRGGELLCYDNSSRASVLSYQSTLRMAARLTPPARQGKKVAVIGQMIFLGKESETWHAKLAEWIDAAGFDRVILVGKYAEVTYAHLRDPGIVVARFPAYDRRHSGSDELRALVDAVDAACHPGDLLFVKGEVDELGEYLQARQRPVSSPVAAAPSTVPAPREDETALAGLRPLTLDDLPRYRAAIAPTHRTTWQHYFPFFYLLGQSPGNRFLVGEDAGSFCLYYLREKKDEKHLCLFLLPMPFQPEVLERCIQRLKTFHRGGRASLFRVDAEDAQGFRGRPNTRIATCPQEYVYAPASYLSLSGNKKRNLRRAIQEIQGRDDIEVLDYQSAHAGECKAVLDQWAGFQRDKYGGVMYGGFTTGCLDQYDQFPRSDLFGKVIRVDGKVCSFGFAGEMRKGMGNLFITYSDLRIDGLNKFLYYCLLRDMEHLEFANASHAGDTPGLAFAKQALGPAYLFQPYQVYVG